MHILGGGLIFDPSESIYIHEFLYDLNLQPAKSRVEGVCISVV